VVDFDHDAEVVEEGSQNGAMVVDWSFSTLKTDRQNLPFSGFTEIW
jgi:hypothetical protein